MLPLSFILDSIFNISITILCICHRVCLGVAFSVVDGRLLGPPSGSRQAASAREQNGLNPPNIIIREYLHLGLSVTFDGFIGGLVTGSSIKIPHCCVILVYGEDEENNSVVLFSTYHM